MSQDKHSKTEKPTPYKLRQERKKGNVPFSKETALVFMIISYTLIIYTLVPNLLYKISLILKHILEFNYMIDNINIISLVFSTIEKIFLITFLPLFIIFFIGIANGLIQNGFIISIDNIKPKINKLSIFSGFNRIFSKESVKNVIISIIKIVIITIILFFSIKDYINIILNISMNLYIKENATLMFFLIKRIMIYVTLLMVIISIIDFIFTKKSYIDKLKMSKQEIKDEFKRQEGDPKIKSKIKSKQIKLINDIIKNIASTDFVIVNPEHYAIGLQYKKDTMPAPKVLIKGVDKVALTIKNFANNKNIPIIEDKLLARSLYDNVDVGQFIHEKYYHAVAEIIRSIYNIK